jgi:MarR family transcriptional regulator, organic hydroperoxide resistance regulator
MNETHLFSFEKPDDNAGYLLWQLSMRWQLKMKKGLDSVGITLTQFVLLAALHWLSRTEEIVTQNDLVQHTQIDKMTTSKVLRTLQNKRWITRNEHAKDTRAKTVYLTEEGKLVLQKALSIVVDVDKRFFSILGEKEVDFVALGQLLMK